MCMDLIAVDADKWPFAVVGWTGSKQMEKLLKMYASQICGYKCTRLGIFTKDSSHHDYEPGLEVPHETTGENKITSEEQVFHVLKLEYLEPEERSALMVELRKTQGRN